MSNSLTKFDHRRPIDEHEELINNIESLKLNLIKDVYEMLGYELGSYDDAPIEYHNYLVDDNVIVNDNEGGRIVPEQTLNTVQNGVESDTPESTTSVSPDSTNTGDTNVDTSGYTGGLISIDDLMKIFPKAKRDYALAALAALEKYGDAVGLNDKGKLMVLAQFAVESGRFIYTAELGKGKGRKYGVPAGPYGKIYYGRGPIQITWEGNYKKIYQTVFPKMGLTANIWADPDICEQNLVIGCAASLGWFALSGNGKRAVQCANNGDVDGLSKAINGGWNAIEHRREYTRKIFQYVSNKG